MERETHYQGATVFTNSQREGKILDQHHANAQKNADNWQDLATVLINSLMTGQLTKTEALSQQQVIFVLLEYIQRGRVESDYSLQKVKAELDKLWK